ncbi:hypothetical protein BRC77_10350 [Halobacteriales archaeon QH_8_64_26]|nr:MAG: hypothetical protein BRC77_10350 [Halobacteriales archaeon QH_8_64_26]
MVAVGTVVVGQLLGSLLSPEALLGALAGGAFGAALGALPAFIVMGFIIVGGEAANIAGQALAQAGAGDPATLGSLGITGTIAFGPPFSPAISFAGGVAAAAYAADRGYMQSGFDFHNAKHIAYALGTKPDVLAVGAVFGVLGYWLQTIFGGLLFPFDGIAMGVTISALIARLAFGYDIIGDTQGYGLLDMSPFEDEEMRVMGESASSGDADGALTDGGTASGRLLVEPWLPHQYKWAGVAVVGAAVGVLGGFITVETGSVFLMFGISAASLVFLNCGVENIPVTHHMALIGSAAAAAVMADGSGLIAGGAALAVFMAGVFGLGAGLFGELFQRIFYAHGDTHWDPPAAAIAFGSFVIAVLAILGVFPGSSYVPTLGL